MLRRKVNECTVYLLETYEECENSETTNNANGNGEVGANSNGNGDLKELNELQKYQLKHRELFYSKQTDTIAVTTIRAKCSVLLFCPEVERYYDYLQHDDLFYYHLTYDPYQRMVVADKGEIRVGLKYQVEIPPFLAAESESWEEERKKLEETKYEELKWDPNKSGKLLNEREIDQFLIIAKSVGTFARALDCNNAFKQPSLPLSAASASRDISLVR